ncbi:cupin domain-containing protein [Pendulispora albinea]|uniref:Cupin domain-containing protein n=1 Tax=Pendulispora albinea TaxID=2741071 RepID=A0ABZ2M6T3_9BACT
MVNAHIVRSSEGEAHEGVPWLFKATARHTQGRFDFLVGTVDYFTGPPLHSHREQEDTFYVLEGILTLQVDDETFDLGPGDFATIPPGVAHTFDNIRNDQPPVKAINLMTFGGFDGFLAEEARLRRQSADPATFEELAEKYGATILGPPLRVKLGLV